MTIWRMRIASWITKATHALTICNTHYPSTATMVAGTRLIVKLHVSWLYCYIWALIDTLLSHSCPIILLHLLLLLRYHYY